MNNGVYFIWPGNPRTDSQLRHSMPLADALPSMVHFSKSRRRARIHLFPSSFIFFPPIPGPTDRPTALEGFASVRPRHFWEREREKRTSDCLCGTADGWMDRPRSPRASSSPIHFSDFLRLIGERERGWSGQWNGGSMKLEIPFRATRFFLSALPASENHGRGRNGE